MHTLTFHHILSNAFVSLTFIVLCHLLPQRSKQRLSKELSDCVVYCKSVHFSSFKHSRIHSKFYEVASFTESKARKHLREAGESNLLAIYKKGQSFQSSIVNPMWKCLKTAFFLNSSRGRVHWLQQKRMNWPLCKNLGIASLVCSQCVLGLNLYF